MCCQELGDTKRHRRDDTVNPSVQILSPHIGFAGDPEDAVDIKCVGVARARTNFHGVGNGMSVAQRWRIGMKRAANRAMKGIGF